MFAAALQDPTTASGTKSQSPDHPSHGFLNTTSETLFRRCDDLLRHHKSTAQAISAIEGPQKAESDIQQGWQQDREKVERLLDLGKRVVERRIEEVVSHKTAEELVGGEEMTEAKSIFEGTVSKEEKQNPGQVLQQMEKGVEKMVRMLPEGDI